MSVLDSILDLVAPHDCIACGLEGSLLCSACVAALPLPQARCYRCEDGCSAGICQSCAKHSPLKSLRSAVEYEGSARTLVHRLKYERAQAAVRLMAVLMTRVCSTEADWYITYAPTTPSRVRIRGYDQAELLAKELAKCLSCPVAKLLRRVTQQHQVGQSGEQRREQMKGAFVVQKVGVVQNAKILLVDDVLTTGATLDAAARALHQAGARHIAGVVFARAGRDT